MVRLERRATLAAGALAVAAFLGCNRGPNPNPPVTPPPRPEPRASAPAPSSAPLPSAPIAAPAPAQLDPDGNDEVASGDVSLPEHAHFEKVGRHWAALTRVCDFAVHGGALYMTHATRPLGLGGATITRYAPEDAKPFSLVFDWNRPGEPEKGGAGGQGFLRIREIDGRLYVPDADPPYLGLALAFGVEGYVFESDRDGRFPAARRPGHLPPSAPTEAKGGALILPGAIHDFDVIAFRGKRYASTGAVVPPKATAQKSPGTLFVAGDESDRWDVAYTYVGAPGEDAVRLGYMTRFRDRLYVAVSPLIGRDRNDYVVFSPPPSERSLRAEDARAVQITPSGGAHTLRWYADAGRLYWVTLGADGGELRVSDDGDHFTRLELPPDSGRPTDVLRVGAHLLVLAEHALLEVEHDTPRVLAAVPGKSPFRVDDAYCAAPLASFDGKLYAGGQTKGELFVLTAD